MKTMNINITTGFKFNRDLFKSDIRNCSGLNKPNGGLWGSPENSEYGWIDWCDSEGFKKNGGIEVYFKWRFKDTAKILKINSKEDYLKILETYQKKIENPYLPTTYQFIDWKELSKTYDGFHLTYNGFCELRRNIYWGFNSWDCESIIAFNLEQIELL